MIPVAGTMVFGKLIDALPGKKEISKHKKAEANEPESKPQSPSSPAMDSTASGPAPEQAKTDAPKKPVNSENNSENAQPAKSLDSAADIENVQAPHKTDENNEKPETQPEAKDKQQPERNDIWKDYPKAKLGAGAAMLAGGIALKLTLIGIVPGLALSAAGLGMMAWGGIIYYQRNKEKGGAKTET